MSLTIDEMLKELKSGKIIRMHHPEYETTEFMSITQTNPFGIPRKDPSVFAFCTDYYTYEGDEPQIRDMHINLSHTISFDELFLCEFSIVTIEEMFREIKEKCKKKEKCESA